MSLSRDTWHKHDDELIEAICREFGLVKPLAMEKTTVPCAVPASLRQNQGPVAGHPNGV